MADKKTRTTLENQFASGKIPTESNFAELIASGINQIDDGLQKAADTPLSIRTTAAADAPKDMVLLFGDFQQPDPLWRIRMRSGSLEISQGANADFLIDENGKVGIGTGSPLAPLSIGDSSVDKSDGFLVIGKKNGGDTRHFRMGFDDKFNFTLGDFGHTNTAGTWKKPFAIHWGAPDSSFYMDSTGKVGIGIGDPKAKLDVDGQMKATSLRVEQKVSIGGADIFEVDAPGIFGGRFKINSNGNVGIGTTEPKAKLDIQAHARTGAHPTINGLYVTGDFEPDKNGVEFRHSNGSQGIGFGYNSIYATGSNANQHLNLLPKGNGNVGIGTINPEDKLDVNGTLRLRGAGNYCQMWVESNRLVFKINNSGHGANKGMSWDGDTNWDAYSDQRLKTNIVKEKDILPRLMQLDVKNYNWKDDPNRKLKLIGFMAQDVKPLFPSLVGEMEDAETKETTLTLKYASFGVLAVGAIKELKQEHDERIAALEAEVAGLKKALVPLMP